MVYDLIPLIPITEIFTFHKLRFFFLVKCMRIVKSLDLLNTKSFMDTVKKYQRLKLEKKMTRNPDIAEDIDQDHTMIVNMILLNYAFKTFRLIVFIFMISYFIGVFIYIWSDILREIVTEEKQESYIVAYELEQKTVV